MVWNKARPTDQERIHDLGSAIRPNWKAIEEASDNDTDAQKLKLWAVNLIDRSDATVTGATTPTRIEDTGQIYCRNDGTENELFFQDSQNPSLKIQMSQSGKLGATTQVVGASNLQFDVNSTLQVNYGINQMIIASCTVSATGTLVGTSTNIASVARTSNPGVYEVRILADVLLNANYRIMSQCFNLTSDSKRTTTITTKPTPVVSTNTIVQVVITGTSNTKHNEQFDFIVIGGR